MSQRKSEINLSLDEIQYIRQTFATIRSTSKTFGADLFIRFFGKHPDFQGMFKSFKDNPIEFGDVPMQTMRVNKKLLAHGTYVLYTVGMLVDHLEFVDTLEQMLKRIARNHHRRRIKIVAFEMLREVWIEQLQVTLGSVIVNDDVAHAWRKFFFFITSVIDIFYEQFEILEVDMMESSGTFGAKYPMRSEFGAGSGAYRGNSGRLNSREQYLTMTMHRANSYSRMNSVNPYFEPHQRTPAVIQTNSVLSPRPKSTCSTEMINIKSKSSSKTKKLLNLVFRPFKFFQRNKD